MGDDATVMLEIDAFEAGTDRWLISINMVSEGVDIPSLRVMSYLTNITSEVYFDQVVGRLSVGRATGIFIPDDPIVREYAQGFRKLRKWRWRSLRSPRRPAGRRRRHLIVRVPVDRRETEEAGIIFGEPHRP